MLVYIKKIEFAIAMMRSDVSMRSSMDATKPNEETKRLT